MSIVMDWDSKFPGDSKIQLISEMQRRWIDGSQGGDAYTPGFAAAELCGILTKALQVTSQFPRLQNGVPTTFLNEIEQLKG